MQRGSRVLQRQQFRLAGLPFRNVRRVRAQGSWLRRDRVAGVLWPGDQRPGQPALLQPGQDGDAQAGRLIEQQRRGVVQLTGQQPDRVVRATDAREVA
jgi:hypothetical protein